MESQVIVAGLYGMSLLLHMERFPEAGETVGGGMIALEAGGKGFNQAVSVSRNHVDTLFLTAVGADDYGRRLEKECASYGFRCTGSAVLENAKTAAAAVMSDGTGESRVVVARGACADVRPDDFELPHLSGHSFLLLQNELPSGVNRALARAVKERGGTVFLNPAPARELEQELLENVDFLIPNWGEALFLAKLSKESARPEEAARKLHGMGVPNVVITMGPKGVFASFEGEEPVLIKAARVKAADTSGAGDTFCGTFVARLWKGDRRREAAVFANWAAGLSVSREGVMQAIPYEKEVKEFIKGQKN